EYEAHPRTFIFSTHLIDEVSLLFEEVLILQDGKFIMQESAETMRKKAVPVTGEKEELEQCIDGEQVIKTKKLANMMTAYIYGVMRHPDNTKSSFEGMPIEDFMLYLTEDKEADAACS